MKATRGIYRMKGSRFWWYRWSENGKRYSVTLKTENETDAIIAKQKILADVQRRGSESFGRSKASTGNGETLHSQMAKVISHYLDECMSRERKPMRPATAKNIRYVLQSFVKESGIESVNDLKPDTMIKWLRSLKKEHSTETIRSHTKNLKAFRRFLLAQGLVRHLEELHMPDAPPIGRKNFLEQDEVGRVIAAVKPIHSPNAKPETISKANQAADELRFILHCGFNAGLRKNEIINARTEWFDLNKGTLHIYSDSDFITKDKDARIIPLKKAFLEFLKAYLPGKKGFILAPDKVRGKSAYRFDFQRRVRSHFVNCGVSCTLHDMRRSFASNLVSKGESVYIVAKWLGDGVSVVEKSYGHLAPTSGNINR